MQEQYLNRRDFLSLTGAIASASLLSDYREIFAQNIPDMAAVRGGEPDIMFDKGIAAFGGMNSFVKKGQTVVIKPNIAWDQPPEAAANTNPFLIKRIVEHCYNAGAKKVYVFDNTLQNWNRCYKSSGIEKAAREAGAVMAPGNSEKYYSEVFIKGADILKSTKVHELILSSDVFINVPVLKHHMSTGVTVSMKNLMGAVWDRMVFHHNDLHACIADLCLYRKPDLNIVDAYLVTMKNGPHHADDEDLARKKMQVISRDIVAADTAAIKIMGKDPSKIRYVSIGNKKGIGSMNLGRLKIAKLTV